jgi:hypothetical protein
MFSAHNLYFLFEFANVAKLFLYLCMACIYYHVNLVLLGFSDPRLHLAQSLHRLSVAYPGRLSPLLSTGLSDADRAHLKNYLDAANVQII